ncbi:MAG: diguanylate cyclase [Acidobacteriota bacterium]|nr:diguanylate cyclase [Acidobacteriota bacterium]
MRNNLKARKNKLNKSINVLIAEDDFIICQELAKTITDWGYNTFIAKDGNEAWEIIQNKDVRIAIFDWMMPGINCIELCRKIREKSHEQDNDAKYLYTILLTGKDQQADVIQGLSAGVDDYMTKPFDFLELKFRIQKGVRIIELEEKRIRLASFDSLTELWNRKKIFGLLNEEFERSTRENNPIGVIMADIDQFKKINDTYGHLVGDHVLVEISSRFRKSLREYDKIGRYGGDEFLILIPGCKPEDLIIIAKRLCKSISEKKIETVAGPLNVTISLGGVSSRSFPFDSPEKLVQASDKALYIAKSKGRNRLSIYKGG